MKKTFSMGVLSAAIVITGCSDNNTVAPAETDANHAFQGNPEIWPQIQSEVSPDDAIERRIDVLLEQMPMEHKVAQMVQGEIRSISPEQVKQYRLGSVLNGGGAYPGNDRYASIDDWLDLADAFWEASTADGLDYPAIPLIWGTDAVHGHNNVVGATLFPHNMGLGAAGNPELMRGIGEATARQVIATGIDWTFAPTVAVAMDYKWGRSYESYGQDPQVVHDYAYEMVRAIQGDTDENRFGPGRIISTVKHFVGDGGTTGGVDQGNTQIDERTLFDVHAQGYVGGLTAGAQTVMASFNTWNGDKLHGHHYMLTTVLKERMGFDGFVVGDWNGHGQVPGCGNDHCAAAINAGVDMIMVPDQWEAFLLNTIEQVKAGEISLERIDDAVRRILRVKIRAGLLDAKAPSERYLAGDTDSLWGEDVRDLSRDAVRQSLVLLKNNDNVLPLQPGQRLLITGNAVHDLSKQMGGWSVTWQGTETSRRDFPNAVDVSDAIAEQATAKGLEVTIDANGLGEGSYDVAIVVFGEAPYAEFNGDRTHIMYSDFDAESLATMQALQAKGTKVVSLFMSGRPMWVNPELNASDAFVAAWLPGSEGDGVAQVLVGDYDFTGRLPGVWPISADEVEALPIGAGGSYESAAPISAELDTTRAEIKVSDSVSIIDGTIDDELSAVLNDVEMSVVDHEVQEDARRFDFASTGGEMSLQSAEPHDRSHYRRPDARLVFTLKASVSEGTRVNLALLSQATRDNMDITELVAASSEWSQWSIPMHCLAPNMTTLASVTSPITIATDGEASLTLADVRWEFSEGGSYDCPNFWDGEHSRPNVFLDQ